MSYDHGKAWMSENILDTLDGFVEPLEKFLEDFEARVSQKERVFSLHEIGFLTLFLKNCYFFTFASLKK